MKATLTPVLRASKSPADPVLSSSWWSKIRRQLSTGQTPQDLISTRPICVAAAGYVRSCSSLFSSFICRSPFSNPGAGNWLLYSRPRSAASPTLGRYAGPLFKVTLQLTYAATHNTDGVE
ncbi:hypothetical protein CSPX01_06894 [Colletotrichum filicis]|nr:hypothetical protein CSPX01_06894 [Colletotrichum filicis]